MSCSIYIADASSFADEDLFRCGYSKVSMYRKLKIDKCRLTNDKARSLAAGLLLDYAIGMFVNQMNQEGVVMVGTEDLLNATRLNGYAVVDGEHGKPMISRHSDIQFSISHSGRRVMVGIGHTPIGVDVQEIKEIRSNIAKRFFSEEEKQYLEKLSGEDWEDNFFRIWALKESYVKYTGQGLATRLDNFSVIDRLDDQSFCHEGYAYAVWE